MVAEQPGSPWLVVTSGFHGDEAGGPLSLLRYAGLLLQQAKTRGFGLRIYFCVNPSGWERNERCNRDGKCFSNAVLQYNVDGVLRDDVPPGTQPRDYQLMLKQAPPETQQVFADITQLPLAQLRGFLDLHQVGEQGDDVTYAYVFGSRRPYRRIIRATAKYARLLAHAEVDRREASDVAITTDADGLCKYHDGSVSDYLDRKGVRYNATVETAVTLPLERVHAVNLTWLLGFVTLMGQA
jgi:hypothetical protein